MNGSPLALVLSGGGAQAAYQVGVLKALAERTPQLVVPIVTGVSAGAINAAHLASHPAPFQGSVEALRGHWRRISSNLVYGVRSMALLRSAARWIEGMALGAGMDPTPLRGLLDNRPLRNFLEGCLDFDGIARNLASGRLHAAAITATSYVTGRTVTFVEGAPGAPTWKRVQREAVRAKLTLDHIMASSAIPLIFPAVKLDGSYFADGSVQQSAPLSPAIHLGATRILAIGTRPAVPPILGSRASTDAPSPVEALTLMLDSVFLDALDIDAERLQRINRLVAAIAPGHPAAADSRPIDLMIIRPSRDLGLIAGECARSVGQLPRAIRMFVRGMGVGSTAGTGFLSYLLFEPAYTDRLVDLGYRDALAQADSIQKFVEGA